ncbi:MAG: HAMP domain-containing sensor histidine kinase [Eubacteriales bacterium]|nr:HAMP domain-containing sensor histidine kinase [Eubacteriales bacterium]
MKKLKLFPRTFITTLAFMALIILLANAIILFLAPITKELPTENADIALEYYAESPFSYEINQDTVKAIQRALPFSVSICILAALLFSYIYSKQITKPIKSIARETTKMSALDRTASCSTQTSDEIGLLADNINTLYHNLLTIIEELEHEKNLVQQAEQQKIDFLRMASHELKTPVTALSAILENMTLGIGKYNNHDIYLPKCKELTDQLCGMIQDILDTSKLSKYATTEEVQEIDISDFLKEICEPYAMIANAKGVQFSFTTSENLLANVPPKLFKKAISNVVLNAVTYTDAGKSISVRIRERAIVIENECTPIPQEHLQHIFEPFYRPDYARNREDGGNGLGLYIVSSILTNLKLAYSFLPMKEQLGMSFTINL